MGRGTWLNWSKQHPQLQTKGFNYKYSKYTKTLLHHIWDPVQGEKRRRRQIDDRTDVVWIRKCISLKLRQFSLKLLHRSTIEFWATIYWTPPLPWTVNTKSQTHQISYSGHTIRYSVHNSAVSAVMRCWWLRWIRCWGCGVMKLRSPTAARRGRLPHHF